MGLTTGQGAVVGVILATALGLLGCGDDSSGPGAPGGGAGNGTGGSSAGSGGSGETGGAPTGGSGGTGGASGSGGTTSSGSWRCLEGPNSCDCYDQATSGYDKLACASYSCCLLQTWPNGLRQCFCSNTSPCTGNSSTTQVAACPP